MDKVKTPVARQIQETTTKNMSRNLKTRKQCWIYDAISKSYDRCEDANREINSVKGLTDTFIRTANGYKVTNPEDMLRLTG